MRYPLSDQLRNNIHLRQVGHEALVVGCQRIDANFFFWSSGATFFDL